MAVKKRTSGVGREIEKKVWPEFFGKVASGEKNFEVRLADFDCRPGDVLVLREWDPVSGKYTGRSVRRKVSYVARVSDLKFWPDEEIARHGLQVIGMDCVQQAPRE